MNGKQKIVFETSIIELFTHGDVEQIKPASPIWSVMNDGRGDISINGIVLKYGQQFGIDATVFVAEAILNNIPVENGTQFTLVAPANFLVSGQGENSAKLIETNFRIVNDD